MKKIIFLFFVLLIIEDSFAQDKPYVFIQLGHTAKITSVAMTKDNRYIVSSGLDKTIKIWDVENNTVVQSLAGHTAGVNKIAISQDNKLIASGSVDGSVKIWNFEKEVHSFPGQADQVYFVGFSPDGRLLFSSGSNDTNTNVWDINGKKLQAKIDNNYSWDGVAFSPDGKLFATIGGNTVIISADNYTKKQKLETNDPNHLDFSPDSKKILSSTDNGMEILDVQSGKLIKKLGKDRIYKAIFTKDGKRIVEMDYHDIKIWDVEKAAVIQVLKAHEGRPTDIFISSDGKKLVSSGEDNSIKLWDLESYRLINTFKSNSAAVNCIAISPDGKFAANGGDDKIIRLWDFVNAKLINSFSQNDAVIRGIAISPDQKDLIISERYLKYFDIDPWKNTRTFEGEYYSGVPVLFSPNGKAILACNMNGEILFIDRVTGRVIRKFNAHTYPIQCLSFSPDGKFFVSAGGIDRTVKFWNLNISSNELSVLTDHTDDVTSALFSPDGNFVASGGADGTLIISEVDYDLGFLRPVKKINTHPISAMSYTPDGEKIIIGSYDKTVSIYDLNLGKETNVFSGHLSTVRGITVSKDGKYAFSSSWDSTTRIWDLETNKEVAMFAGFSDGEWVIITPEGYFNASPKGAGYLTVKIGNNYYTMDNYLETFFRPDLVKLALAGINLKNFSSLDEVQLAPNIKIQSCDIKDDEANLAVKITDNGGGIGDIRIFLNEAAIILESGRGIKIASKDGSLVKNYKFKLQNGENTIRVIAFNEENTMQSNRSEITVEFNSTVLKNPSLYAVIIGINEYENQNLDLRYAVPDAFLFSNTLTNRTKSLFDNVEIKLLSEKNETTKNSIIKSLQSFNKFNPEDLFVFYIASHGTISDGQYYIITSNVGSTSTKKLQEDALSQNFIKELIANIPTSKKLIILDTCSSQALANDLQIALLTRGLSEDAAVKVLSRAVGVTILCAAKSNQEALEGYKDHGLFTYVLTEGLDGEADYDKDGYVKTFELADYIDNEVHVLAEEVFKVAQDPIVSPAGQGFPIGKVKD